MKSRQPGRPIFELFTPFFRIHVHQLIAKGHEKARSQIRPDSEEEDTTGYLYEAIKDYLCSDCPDWFLNYDIHNEAPFAGGARTGRSRKEMDLVIVYTQFRGRPEYVLEAKPLNYNKKHQRESNYTNKEALQRFLKGEYAEYTSRFPEVAMLGYVLSDTPEIWRTRLKASIDKKKVDLRLRTEQYDIKVIDDIPVEWVSEHNRDSSAVPLIVCHILLNCCEQNTTAS